jgi:hypothetical protein
MLFFYAHRSSVPEVSFIWVTRTLFALELAEIDSEYRISSDAAAELLVKTLRFKKKSYAGARKRRSPGDDRRSMPRGQPSRVSVSALGAAVANNQIKQHFLSDSAVDIAQFLKNITLLGVVGTISRRALHFHSLAIFHSPLNYQVRSRSLQGFLKVALQMGHSCSTVKPPETLVLDHFLSKSCPLNFYSIRRAISTKLRWKSRNSL